MKPTDLSVHVTNFLTRHLAAQRNLSPNTIKAYRDVFTLVLRFGRDVRGIAVERLALADIDVTFVEAFLDHLGKDRHCSGFRARFPRGCRAEKRASPAAPQIR